jgi:tRNA-(ms[2]io[6]A)-hydroxylase
MSAAAAPASEAPSRVKWLASASSEAWLEQALRHPDLILIDHAHCERKAAGVALQLMFRYPSDAELAATLSPLAQEELQHFDRVLALLQQRGVALRPLAAPPYGAGLSRAVRREEPGRMLDSFLVAGLIEARSHERMGMLAHHLSDPELRALYWVLCERRWPRSEVIARLEELAALEAELLASLHPEPRLHS